MPWKECHVMDERLRFVARLLEGEKMAALCEEFGISRKTGYKIYRALQGGRRCSGLTDRSRRPHRHANQLPMVGREADRAAEAGISQLGRAEDSRAAAAAVARGALSGDQHGPRGARPARPRAASARADAPRASRARRCPGPARPIVSWCADYKGEFLLGNRRYCYPLTITDFASRYLLACEALVDDARSATPSRSSSGPSRIWAARRHPHRQRRALRLRARALRPEQARRLVAPPRHWARAHRPGPSRAERPARADAPHAEDGSDPARRAPNVLQQQARFDTFVHRFNHERPHQALDDGDARPVAISPRRGRISGARGARVSRATTGRP